MRAWTPEGFTEDQQRRQNDLLEQSKKRLPKISHCVDVRSEEGVRNAYILKHRVEVSVADKKMNNDHFDPTNLMSQQFKSAPPAAAHLTPSMASTATPGGNSGNLSSTVSRTTTVDAVRIAHDQYLEELKALGVNTDTSDNSRPTTAPTGSQFGGGFSRASSARSGGRSLRCGTRNSNSASSRATSANSTSALLSKNRFYSAETLQRAAERHERKRKLQLGQPRNPLFEGHWAQYKKLSVVALERSYKTASKKKCEERREVREAHYEHGGRDKGLNVLFAETTEELRQRNAQIARARKWRDEIHRKRIRDDVASLFDGKELMRDFVARVKKVRDKLLKADPQLAKFAAAAPFVEHQGAEHQGAEHQGAAAAQLFSAAPGPGGAVGAQHLPGAAAGGAHPLLQLLDDPSSADFLDSIARSWPHGYKKELFKWLGRLFKSVIAVEGLQHAQHQQNQVSLKLEKVASKQLKHNQQVQRLFAIIDQHFLEGFDKSDTEVESELDPELLALRKVDFNLEKRLDGKEKERIDAMLALQMGIHAPRWKGFAMPIYGSPQFYGLAPPPDPPEETFVALEDAKEFERQGLQLFRKRITHFGYRRRTVDDAGQSTPNMDERRGNQEKARDVYTQLPSEKEFYRGRRVPHTAWNANETLLGSVFFVDFLWEVLEKQSLKLEQKKEFVRLIAQQRAEARRNREPKKATVENVELFPARQMMLQPPRGQDTTLVAGKGTVVWDENHGEALERITVNVETQKARDKKDLFQQRQRIHSSLGMLFNSKLELQGLQSYLARGKFGDVDFFLRNYRENHPSYNRPGSESANVAGGTDTKVSYSMGKNVYREVSQSVSQMRKSMMRSASVAAEKRALAEVESDEEGEMPGPGTGDPESGSPLRQKSKQIGRLQSGGHYLTRSHLVVPRGIVKALVNAKHAFFAVENSGREAFHDRRENHQKRLLAAPKSDPVLKSHLERAFMRQYAAELKARSIILSEKHRVGPPPESAEVQVACIPAMLHQLRHIGVSETKIEQVQELGLCRSGSMNFSEWLAFYNTYCAFEVEDLSDLFHDAVRRRRNGSRALAQLAEQLRAEEAGTKATSDDEPLLDMKGFLALLMKRNGWSLLGESYANDIVEAVRAIFDDCEPKTHEVHVVREEEEDVEETVVESAAVGRGGSVDVDAVGSAENLEADIGRSASSPSNSVRKTNVRFSANLDQENRTDEETVQLEQAEHDGQEADVDPPAAVAGAPPPKPPKAAKELLPPTKTRPASGNSTNTNGNSSYVNEFGEMVDVVTLKTINFGQFARMYYYAVKSHGFARDDIVEIEDAFSKFHVKFVMEVQEITDKVNRAKQKMRAQRRFKSQSQGVDNMGPAAAAAAANAVDPDGGYNTVSETEEEMELRMLSSEEKLERWAVECGEKTLLINLRKSVRPLLNWLGYPAEELPEREIEKCLAQCVTKLAAENRFGTQDPEGDPDLLRKLLAEKVLVPINVAENGWLDSLRMPDADKPFIDLVGSSSEEEAGVAKEGKDAEYAARMRARRSTASHKSWLIPDKHLPPENYWWFNFPQVLYVLSLFREYFSQSVCDRFHQADADGSGGVDSEELRHILSVVNSCNVSEDVLRDLYADAKDLQDELTLEEFNEVYKLFRTRAGFSNEEIAEYHAAFDKFAEPLSTLKRLEENRSQKMAALVTKTGATGTHANGMNGINGNGGESTGSPRPSSDHAGDRDNSRSSNGENATTAMAHHLVAAARAHDNLSSSDSEDEADHHQHLFSLSAKNSMELGGASAPSSPGGQTQTDQGSPTNNNNRSLAFNRSQTTSLGPGAVEKRSKKTFANLDEEDGAWLNDVLHDPATMRVAKEVNYAKKRSKSAHELPGPTPGAARGTVAAQHQPPGLEDIGYMKIKFARNLRKTLRKIRKRGTPLISLDRRHRERVGASSRGADSSVTFLSIAQLDKVFRWLGYDAMPEPLTKKASELGIDFALDRFDFLKVAKAVTDSLYMSFTFRWGQISHLNPLDGKRYCTYKSVTTMLIGLGYATSLKMANKAALQTCPGLDWLPQDADAGMLAMLTVPEPVKWPDNLEEIPNEETREMLRVKQRISEQRNELIRRRSTTSAAPSSPEKDEDFSLTSGAGVAGAGIRVGEDHDEHAVHDVPGSAASAASPASARSSSAAAESATRDDHDPRHEPPSDEPATQEHADLKIPPSETVLKDKWMSERQCRQACAIARQLAKKNYQSFSGFSDVEVLGFKQNFMRYAVQVSDLKTEKALYGHGLRKVLLDLFPDASKDPAVHMLMSDVLDAVDRDRSGTIDFAEYLQIMRVHADAKQHLL
eukprot:g1506.t1